MEETAKQIAGSHPNVTGGSRKDQSESEAPTAFGRGRRVHTPTGIPIANGVPATVFELMTGVTCGSRTKAPPRSPPVPRLLHVAFPRHASAQTAHICWFARNPLSAHQRFPSRERAGRSLELTRSGQSR